MNQLNRYSKLLLVTVLFLVGLFGKNITVDAAVTYKDVPTKYWAYSQINEATALGYFEGDGNGYFKPNASITRAEFAVVMSRLFDGTERVTESFTDISNTFWGKDAIEELLALGVISKNDFSNNKFEPFKVMTRSELAKWFTNALSVQQPSYKDVMKTIRDSNYTLLPIAEYLRGSIKKAEQGYIGVMLGTELFTGYTDGSFKPSGNTSRSEVAALAIRFKKMQAKAPVEFRGLNELLEVSETGTNMLSATKFKYSSLVGNTTVKDVLDKPYTLKNNIGTAELKRLIFVEGHETVQETWDSSIFAKMFITKSMVGVYADSVNMYIDQTLIPNKKIDGLTLSSASTNGFINPYRVTGNPEKYGLVSLPNEEMDKFFTVGKETRYWTKYPFDKKGYNYINYVPNDGKVFSFYSTY